MPALILVPVLFVGLVLLWALLLPLILVQRYRLGSRRQRVTPWVVRLNGTTLLLSAISFLVGAAISSRWVDGAFAWSAGALAAGCLLGAAGLGLSRLERTDAGLWITPNRLLIGLLTAVVAARIALGLWQLWHHARGDATLAGAWARIDSPATLLAVGALLLGYYLAQAWLLRRHLPPPRRRR